MITWHRITPCTRCHRLCDPTFRSNLRCSRPLCSSQNTGGISRARPKPNTTRSEDRHTRHHNGADAHGPEVRTTPPPTKGDSTGPVPQDPTACKRPTSTRAPVPTPRVVNNTEDVLRSTTLTWPQCQCSTHERCPTRTGWCNLATLEVPVYRGRLHMLLRKEVIQPHLPVRLPCYDLVLITDPTFDSSLLAVGPLASGVTDFHDLTGGVYKARERIHRSVADLRLLATPTS